MAVQAVLRRWLGDYVVAIVVLMVIVVPLLRFDSSASAINRNVVLQLMGILLWCVVLLKLDWGPGAARRCGQFLQSGVNALALLFFGWAVISALWVAPAGVGRAFAMNDLLRLGAGVLVYLVVANHVESRRQIETLVDAVLLIVAAATLYRIFIPQTLPGSPSLIGTRLMAGGFLCLLLPVAAAVAAAPSDGRRQIAGRVVTILTVVALLVALARSSWIGALAGMAVFGMLALRHLTAGAAYVWRHRRHLVYPAVALGGVLAAQLAWSGIGRESAPRVQTLSTVARGEDASFQWRLREWEGALAAIARRPVLGMGLGNYVLRQNAFTQQGQTEEQVARDGASMEEQAHNEYLQLAAEMGVPGLLLYLLMLMAFFAKAAHALGRLPVGMRKTMLIGCIAGIAGQCVDAVSNPAWRYSVCALYFWLILGLGVALVRMAYRSPAAAAVDERIEEAVAA